MNYSFREATIEDAVELARLRWEFRPREQKGQEWTAFAVDFESWFRQALLAGNWMPAVAESTKGQLIGCVFLQSVGKIPVPGTVHRCWGYVTNFYVVPNRRGQGVGGGLLEVVKSAARSKGHEFLIVWPSEEAVSLYDRAGFQEVAVAHAGPDDYPPLELVL